MISNSIVDVSLLKRMNSCYSYVDYKSNFVLRLFVNALTSMAISHYKYIMIQRRK